METGIIELKRNNGTTFRVLYLNRSQKKRIINCYYESLYICTDFRCIVNGIHTVKQFEEIIDLEYINTKNL